MKEKADTRERQLDLDCLRIIATFGVVVLHTVSLHWGRLGIGTFEWHVINFYNSIMRWTVPVFVMISGALFLEGTQSTAQIYKKNILRIVTSFIFWSAAYAFMSFSLFDCGVKWAIRQFFQGYYHLWFLFMIVGLYIVTPFLRKIVSSEELTKYFLGVCLVFTFILPQGIELVIFRFGNIGQEIKDILENVNLYFTLGYVGYFVCGYYLNKRNIDKKGRRIIALLGIMGFLATTCLTAYICVKRQSTSQIFFSNFTVNVMLQSLMVFVFGKKSFGAIRFSPKAKEWIVKLSKYSFGAYLVHAMLIEIFSSLCGFDALSFNPVFAVPVAAVVVFVLSFIISGILNHIPVLNKYIV